ncbi:hypothetical protein [Blastococcus brunescens]|uniref:Uncharacterized protein n=1 Tax=Blastococcus brunescens TaxID=1564165 RepID=A0ABZ1B126_9ACTN|nr:hypothetical protein [Blastococcus sp. BMG 8361]WRL64490.1 hypothetical protein U6N30_01190 [Blastococcus sp. BMG 8361]
MDHREAELSEDAMAQDATAQAATDTSTDDDAVLLFVGGPSTGGSRSARRGTATRCRR